MNPDTNPGLYLLHIKDAFKHLLFIDAMLKKLRNFSNINMLDLIHAIEVERKKLTTKNPAYDDADDLIQIADDLIQILNKG